MKNTFILDRSTKNVLCSVQQCFQSIGFNANMAQRLKQMKSTSEKAKVNRIDEKREFKEQTTPIL